MRWPWTSKKNVEQALEMRREVVDVCKRAFDLMEKKDEELTSLRNDLQTQKTKAAALEQTFADADQEFLRQCGINRD